MIRLHIVLVLFVVGSAIAVVTMENQSRRNFTELKREQERTRQLEEEWRQLQLEQEIGAAPAQIERKAREAGLRPPTAAQTRIARVLASAPQDRDGDGASAESMTPTR